MSLPKHRTLVSLALPLLAATASADASGRVFGPDGQPLGGASITAYRVETSEARTERLLAGRPRPPLATARSAAHGTYRLQMASGPADVQARADGFAPARAHAVEGEPAVVGLRRARTLRGLVTAKGKAVAGAMVVWMSGDDYDISSPEVTVTTGADGSYEVPDPDVWATRMVIVHPDFVPFEASPEMRAWRLPLRHDLQVGVDVEGSVIDGATGRSAGGAAVWIDDWPRARSRADGSFLIRHAPADWTAVMARGPGSLGTGSRNAARALVIRMRPARSLAGAVRDAGSNHPLAGAIVRLYNERGESFAATTDARGQHVFDSLAPTRYFAYVSRRGYSRSKGGYHEANTVDLRKSSAPVRDFLLTRLARVRGQVRDEDGRPVDGALVTAGDQDAPGLYADADLTVQGPWTRTTPEGAFVLEVPADEETTSLTVHKDGFAMGHGGAGGTITLTTGVEVQGRVRDRDGRPISGVAVALGEEGSFVAGHVQWLLETFQGDGWTRSDADGLFRARVHPRPHSMALYKKGHSPRMVRGHDPRSGQALEVVLDPAVEIRGRVVRPGGQGVADVHVSAQQPGAARAFTTQTDAEGAFTVADLAPGAYQLFIRNAAAVESRSVVAPSSDVRIELDPTGQVRGRVLDARTRRSVRSFQVDVVPETRFFHGSARSPHGRTFDDENGTFVVGDLSLGEVALTVRAEGYVAERLEGLAVSVDGEAPEAVFALEPAVQIRGRVTSEEGEALFDALVSVPGDARVPPVQTDESGDYELAGVPSGSLKLEFRREGFRTARRTHVAGEAARLDVALSRGLALTGTVFRDGVGLAGAGVSASSAVTEADSGGAKTDANGKFRIEGLSPGRYSVSAMSDESEQVELHDVDVETAGPLRLVIDRLPTAVLTGRVAGLTPDDAGYVSVTAEGEDGRDAQANVDARGEFRMDKAPAGRIRVHAQSGSISGAIRSSRTNELTLAPGSQNQTVLEFHDDFTVAGTVTAGGAPVAAASVHWAPAGRGGVGYMGRTGPDGRYEVLGLEAGPYAVRVSAGEVSVEIEHVVSGNDRVDIDATGAGVVGRTVQADGTPLAGVDVSLWRLDARGNKPATSVTSGAGGDFSVRWLREGRYRLVGAKEGFGQDVQEVDLSRGVTSELLLKLQATDGLKVSVVDARDGRALDATVVVRDAGRQIVARTHSRVEADGTLRISLASGAYLLSASANGYGTATLPVTAPGEGPRVGLTPGGTLVVESPRDLRGRLRLVRPDGEEYVRCVCNGIADIEVKGRRTTVPNVTPGSYSVEFVDAGNATVPGTPVVIREGQVSMVSIE